MLTGTCDVCHETMSFADDLAGKTVRCEQCGNGLVHVSPTAGVTAFVPGLAEKRSADRPDTAITDKRPMAMSAPLMEHHVVAGTCPRCGSTAFRQVRADRKTALTNDRECKECGTRYTTIHAPRERS
jgi:predicted RNA-binding Zn-ribbon protein involved in translation (DUF1610 family)